MTLDEQIGLMERVLPVTRAGGEKLLEAAAHLGSEERESLEYFLRVVTRNEQAMLARCRELMALPAFAASAAAEPIVRNILSSVRQYAGLPFILLGLFEEIARRSSSAQDPAAAP